MIDLAHHPHLLQCSYPKRPISWGKDGRTNRLIVERIESIENDLKQAGVECKVGGDMNFEFQEANNFNAPAIQAAREKFMQDVKDELCVELEKKRTVATGSDHNPELGIRLQEIRGFNFKECFMAKLNHECRDVVEFNFPRANYPNNLFDKPVKGYFDQTVPEFQMHPKDCLTFLDNTQRVYKTAQEMASALGYTIVPATQHIHFSVWKDGKNLTTRDETTYAPSYVKILESVAHLTKKSAFLLYPLNEYPAQNFVQHMRISENKIARHYEMSLRALKDRFEFRALNSEVPHLALALLVNLAGVHIGMTKHNDDFCKKHDMWRAQPENPVKRPFFQSSHAFLNFFLKQCNVNKDGFFRLRKDWAASTPLVHSLVQMEQLYFDKEILHTPPLIVQWLEQIKIENGKIIVPDSFEGKVRYSAPYIKGSYRVYQEDVKDHGEECLTLIVKTPPELKTAMENAYIGEYHDLVYEDPQGLILGVERQNSHSLRKESFSDPLLKEYFGKALTAELAKDYNRAFDEVYPKEKGAVKD